MLLVAPHLHLSGINNTNLCHIPELALGFPLYPRSVTTGHTESRASFGAPRGVLLLSQGLTLPNTQNPEHLQVLPWCAPPTPDLQLRTARQRNVGPRGARSPQKANATPLSLAVCVRASPWLLQLRLLHHILGVMLLSS